MEELKVTPALLIALFQKPQDRVFLIDLENSVLDFVESSAYTYQLKPMNSYYRLLSHQVAEYHGLQHTVSKDNDKCVIVYKQNDYEPNANLILLQELEPQVMYQFPPEYYALASMAAANNQQQLIHKTIRQKPRQSSQHHTPVSAPEHVSDNQTTRDNAQVTDAKSAEGVSPAAAALRMSIKKKVKILKREVETDSGQSRDLSHEATTSTSIENTLEEEKGAGSNKDSTVIDLEEQRRIKEQQYNEEKEKIFSGSPSSLTPVSTPPATPVTLNSASGSNGEADDSPQPHQFETSRFNLNHQNEMKYLKKTQYQHNNKRQNSHNNRYNKPLNRQPVMHPYYGVPPPMAPMRPDSIPFGYQMVAPMEYMYYPIGAPMTNNRMMIPGQPMYAMPPPVFQPYEKKNSGKNDSNGYKKNGKPINEARHFRC